MTANCAIPLVRCIPIVTGEDLPRDDAASIARILLVTFDWQRGEPNDLLTSAQRTASTCTPSAGRWIEWLRSDEAAAQPGPPANHSPGCAPNGRARLSRIERTAPTSPAW